MVSVDACKVNDLKMYGQDGAAVVHEIRHELRYQDEEMSVVRVG